MDSQQVIGIEEFIGRIRSIIEDKEVTKKYMESLPEETIKEERIWHSTEDDSKLGKLCFICEIMEFLDNEMAKL